MNQILKRIEKYNAALLPEMVELKYRLIMENPFRFFRGTCHLFYEDLSKATDFPQSPVSWICGDLHVENFGSYRGANRQVYFDLNDFDEAMLAPLCWELARILTSIYVALEVLEVKPDIIDQMASLYLDTYINSLKTGKANSIDPRTAQGVVRTFLNKVKRRTQDKLINKMTDATKNELSLKIDNKSHFKLPNKLRKKLTVHVNKELKNAQLLSEYRVKDIAFRVAGTGSVGLKRYMLLLRHASKKDNYLLAELKQSKSSSLAAYNKIKQPLWTSEAERINTVKYRMQSVSPMIIGTSSFEGQVYVFQEMQPYADKIKYSLLTNGVADLKKVLIDMAILTASAQLRSSGIQGSAINDELTAFAADPQWRAPLLAYAKKYAERVQSDYMAYKSQFVTSTQP